MQLSFNYIDTCYPDNLTDHHNRENEWLVAVNWYEGITSENLTEEIVDEIMSNWPERDDFTHFFSALDDDTTRRMLKRIIELEVSSIDLDVENVDCPDEMIIYSYLSW